MFWNHIVKFDLTIWFPDGIICEMALPPRKHVRFSLTIPEWQDARIRSVEILKKPGDSVRPPFENADRIGYVMVCAPTRSEAEQLADNFVLQTTVKLK